MRLHSRFKTKVFALLHRGAGNSNIIWIARALELLIILNVVAVILETFEDIDSKYSLFFESFEIFTVIVFLVEYILRIWISDLVYPAQNKWKSAWKMIISINGIIDLLAILPFFLPFVLKFDLRHLRILRLARLLRVFQIHKYNHSLRLITKVLSDKKTELLGTFLIAMCILIVSSTLIFYVERIEQPDKFPNILNAFWWCIVTLTTIGYGDIVPVTIVGKIIGGTVAVLGVLLMAIPIGILSTGFVQNLEEHNKKKRILSIRNQIKDAFRKRFVPELDCEVRRGALSIEAIKVSLEISDEELIKLAEGKNEFSYRRILLPINGNLIPKFCLEFRECNTTYGIFHKKDSPYFIISPESHNKQSIGYLSYCISEMLRCSHISNEFFADEAVFSDETFGDKGVDRSGTFNFSVNNNYLLETDKVSPKPFTHWKNNIFETCNTKKINIIFDSHIESETTNYKINVFFTSKRNNNNAGLFINNLNTELRDLMPNIAFDVSELQTLAKNHLFYSVEKRSLNNCIYISISNKFLITHLFIIASALGKSLKKV